MVNKFNIKILHKKPKKVSDNMCFKSKITIGEYDQIFDIPLSCWSLHDYYQQWVEGLQRIKTYSNSCLVISVVDLLDNPWIEIWELDKTEDTVFFSYRLLISLTVQKAEHPFPLSSFNHNTCYSFLLPRIANEHSQATDKEGNILMEWGIPIDDFFESLPHLSIFSSAYKETILNAHIAQKKYPSVSEDDSSEGQLAFYKGTEWITPSIDVAAAQEWKKYRRRFRIGTYDNNLIWISK